MMKFAQCCSKVCIQQTIHAVDKQSKKQNANIYCKNNKQKKNERRENKMQMWYEIVVNNW